MMVEMLIIIVLAFILDSIIGDPQSIMHPVRLIGHLISFFTSIYKKNSVNNHILSFIYGGLMAIIVILVTFFSTYIVIEISLKINQYFGYFIQVLLCYYAISPKALKVESMKVYNALKKRDINQARENLSYIVGRDTKNLNEEGIIKAT
ncbi:MAG: cobalamin biosynthesis protein, partial [Bacilli bacterium]